MKVGIYCRVSSLTQKKEGYSLQNQRDLGVKYCEENGWDYEVFTDTISGSKVNRNQLEELFEKILYDEINGIILWEWSRLERSSELRIKFIQLLEEKPKTVVIVDGRKRDIINDLGDRMEYEITSTMGSIERWRLMKRVKSGSINRLKNGYVRSQLKRGFNKVKGVVTINEEESKLVRDVFKIFLYKNVPNVKVLTDKINEKYNLRLTDSTLKRYLSWEGYKGKIKQTYKEFEVETKIPQIIDDETFELTQKKLQSILSKRKGRDNMEYLLKGMCYCGDCGNKMYKRGSVSRRSHKRNKDGSKRKSYGKLLKYQRDFHYYNCSVNGYRKINETIEEYKERLSRCKNSYKKNSINFGMIDKVVWKGLFMFLNNSDSLLKEYKNKSIEEKTKLGRFKGKRGYYVRRIDELKTNKYELYKDWKDNKISEDDYHLYNEEFTKEIDESNKRINEIDNYEINEIDDKILENVIDFMKNDLSNKERIGDNFFKVKRKENESDDSYYKRKNKGLKDMKRLIDKYLNKIYVKRLGEEEYNIKFEFRMKLSKVEKEVLKNLVIKDNNKLFYIKESKLYLQFSYIEEKLWNYSFNFRYIRKQIGSFNILYSFNFFNEKYEVC